jgi:hypothetical protein
LRKLFAAFAHDRLWHKAAVSICGVMSAAGGRRHKTAGEKIWLAAMRSPQQVRRILSEAAKQLSVLDTLVRGD